MKNTFKEFLYDLEINTENLKTYTDIIEEQLQEIDEPNKIYAINKAITKEIQEMQTKITDLEHKIMEVK